MNAVFHLSCFQISIKVTNNDPCFLPKETSYQMQKISLILLPELMMSAYRQLDIKNKEDNPVL